MPSVRNLAALPALRGGLLALLAAALFGISMPPVQPFGLGLGAFSTAALRCAGATAVGLLSHQPIEPDARLPRADLPRLIALAGLGAVVGPVALPAAFGEPLPSARRSRWHWAIGQPAG